MRNLLKTFVAAFSLALVANCAQAAPITWTFTGLNNFVFSATGDLAGTVAAFDTFELKHTFEPAAPCGHPFQCIYSGGALSLKIGGMTFTVGPPSALPQAVYKRTVLNDIIAEGGLADQIEGFNRDYTVQHLAGGNATSSLNRDAFISLSYNLHNTIVDFLPDVAWPTSVDLEALQAAQPTNYSSFHFSFTSATGSLEIFDPITAFETMEVTTSSVPEPTSLVLFGLGVLGLGATRRNLNSRRT